MDEPLPAGLLQSISAFFKNDIGEEDDGRDFYQSVFNDPLFFPLQRQQELAAMMRIARSFKPKVVYEIGSDKGGGLYHWCRCLPTVQRVIACEIRGVPYHGLFQNRFPDLDFLWLPESSFDPRTVNHVRGWLGTDRIDCLFIDGDKSHFDTDFDAYLPLMNPRSVVFMHDVQDSAPVDAFKRVVARGYDHQVIIDKSDTVAAMKLEHDSNPPLTPHERWLRHWQGRSCGVGVIYLGKRPC